MTRNHLIYTPYHPDKDGEILQLFNDYSFKDYQIKFMGASKERMVDYLKKSLRQPDLQTICLIERNKVVGFISLKPLPWLSRHFGFRMYGVTHLLAKEKSPLIQARLLRYVAEETNDVDFLDCRIAANDVHGAHALEICGFRYVGAEIYLGQILKKEHRYAPRPLFKIDPCRQASDRDQVLKIAGQVHLHNRFHYDPFIKEENAQSLYRALVANCFDDDQFEVLMVRSSAMVEGFIVSKFNRPLSQELGFGCASLDFIGVRPETQNRGLGQALNQWALHQLAGKKVAFVGVRTMASNYSALTVCHKTGFQMTSASLHFHKWIYRPRVSPEVSFNLLQSFESINNKVLFGGGMVS
jgi:predicted N-acetyltransferase YhbS